jgi:hypothetical protein
LEFLAAACSSGGNGLLLTHFFGKSTIRQACRYKARIRGASGRIVTDGLTN